MRLLNLLEDGQRVADKEAVAALVNQLNPIEEEDEAEVMNRRMLFVNGPPSGEGEVKRCLCCGEPIATAPSAHLQLPWM